MGSFVEDFIPTTLGELLVQLLKTAQHVGIEVTYKCLKENVKTLLNFKLVEDEILFGDVGKRDVTTPAVILEALMFKQQNELLMIQLEHDRMIQHKQLKVEMM